MDTAWMRDPAQLTVNALAAARLTRLWTRDSLPPLPRLRQAVLDKLDAVQRQRGQHDDHPLVALVNCPWCIGFWLSAAVAAAATLAPQAWRPIGTALAFSQTTGLLARLDHDDD